MGGYAGQQLARIRGAQHGHRLVGELLRGRRIEGNVLVVEFAAVLVQRGEEIWKVVIWPDFSIVGIEDMKAGTSSNPARAWLIVILEALIAQEDT